MTHAPRETSKRSAAAGGDRTERPPVDVSVIVPAYNVSKYLERCVSSIQAAPIPRLEILIVNDGSQDGTSEIARALARDDARIRVFDQENAGLSRARNVGLANSGGRYVAFVDADDYLDPVRFASAVSSAETSGADVIVAGAVLVDDATREIVERREPLRTAEEMPGPTYLRHALLAGKVRMCAPYNIYSGELVRDVAPRFHPGIFHEDELWTPQVLLAAERVITASQPYYFHSVRPFGSIMSAKNARARSADLLQVVAELDPVVEVLADSRLRTAWDDYRMSLFLSAVFSGSAGGARREAWSYPAMQFLRRARTSRNRARAALYLVSPTLYVRVNRIYKVVTGRRSKIR